MNYEPEYCERASGRLLDEQSTQVRYTASSSYLVEAELDREWEKKVWNGKPFPEKRSGRSVQEEGRA